MIYVEGRGKRCVFVEHLNRIIVVTECKMTKCVLHRINILTALVKPKTKQKTSRHLFVQMLHTGHMNKEERLI